jgi:predicted aldo/keto reductase-like oxidoreductase
VEQTILGRTGLTVGRTGFGGIPIQRISYDESTEILRYAYDNGVTLYDTAHGYSTSQERIGIALGGVRHRIVIATKSPAAAPEDIVKNLDNSLKMLKTDYIDVYQVHGPSFVPRPGGEDGVYDCFQKARQQGKIRHIGISAHKKHLAKEAVLSGLYDTLQYPFSYLSSGEELELAELCKKHNVGILGMKGLCGGLLTNIKGAFAFLRQYPNIVPIWGIQKLSEIQEFIGYENSPPPMDEALEASIDADKRELAGSFCRGCGYCLPCPAGIPISLAARITFLLGRSVKENFFTPEWKQNMDNINKCTNCGHCIANCPYELDVPALLKQQLAGYLEQVQSL